MKRRRSGGERVQFELVPTADGVAIGYTVTLRR
jgi:hypothetical protein